MSDQNNTSLDNQSSDKPKIVLTKPITPHYNQWGSSGQCKVETPKKCKNDSTSKPKQIYFIDDIKYLPI